MDDAINWKTELRKIDREFDGLPPEPSPEELHARHVGEQRAQQLELQERQLKEERLQQQLHLFGIWARVTLVGMLSLAMAFWPYSHRCGFGLFAYMAAAIMVIFGGVWAAFFGWHFRMIKVHGLALAMVLWGLILFTAQVLPRNGYAQVDPHNPPTWLCRN